MTYTNPVGQRPMLRDAVRNSAYQAALADIINEDSVVLDLGAGTGVLGLIAASLGAARVYQVEPATPLEVAMELAESNGLRDRIIPLQGEIESVTLPESVDVIISVFTGNFLLEEDLLPSLFYARDRYLKPGGVLLPDKGRMWCAPVSLPGFYDEMIGCWQQDQLGLSHAVLSKYAFNSVYYEHFNQMPHEMAAPPQCLHEIDFMGADEAACSASSSFKFSASKEIHGFLGWFDMQLGHDWLSTGPEAESTHWSQVFLPLDRVLEPGTGDEITIDINRPEFGEWSWRWQSGHQSAQHSVFLSRPFTPEVLQRRADSYQPALTDRGAMARWVLDHMDGTRNVNELARGLVEALAHPNQRKAEQFVRQLIESFGE